MRTQTTEQAPIEPGARMLCTVDSRPRTCTVRGPHPLDPTRYEIERDGDRCGMVVAGTHLRPVEV